MDRKEIKDLIKENTEIAIKKIGMDRSEIENLVQDKISIAIEERKKAVSKQLKVWGGSISAIFSFLLIIGFTTDDIITATRNIIAPTSHIVKQLLNGGDQSEQLKRNIIAELEDSSFKNYPKVKQSLENNVWRTLETADDKIINNFLKNTKLDEAIIDSYYDQVIIILFSNKESGKRERKETILKTGGVPHPVLIGEYKNKSGTKTNCALPFKQNKKRIIIHIPGSDPDSNKKREKIPLPWFQCPRGYHNIDVSLKIEDVEVNGIRVVGVERPTESIDIKGVRARVTAAVADEFKSKGIDLGQHVTLRQHKGNQSI